MQGRYLHCTVPPNNLICTRTVSASPPSPLGVTVILMLWTLTISALLTSGVWDASVRTALSQQERGWHREEMGGSRILLSSSSSTPPSQSSLTRTPSSTSHLE